MCSDIVARVSRENIIHSLHVRLPAIYLRAALGELARKLMFVHLICIIHADYYLLIAGVVHIHRLQIERRRCARDERVGRVRRRERD